MAPKPTIKDVAREAGVSVATVSRVLNRSGYFDEATGRAVHDAVARLGYRRNVHWQRISNNASRTLCFLLGNRAGLNSMQMRMLVACERVCKEQGFDLVFSRLDYPIEGKAARIELPRIVADQGLVDGVILVGRHAPNLLELLGQNALPWVMLGNNFEGDFHRLPENTLSYDEEAGSADATAYLARLGHRRIAFIGNRGYLWFRRRQKAYEKAMREAGLTPLSVDADWEAAGAEYGSLAAAELLRRKDAPTAIFASNDEVAAGVWKEVTRRGYRIPLDISLCGFGDREEFQILEPPLTSIAVFPERLGAELARMILARLKDPATAIPSRIFPCQFIERGSCAPPPSRLKAVKA
ncbi:MAG: LacI family DNA-binding transcriptional regulator [Bryobacteraceae bacterium]|nr:LacI family DNA-binding transcriptional regulator [Bryobacteraceae bacterium]